MTDRVSAGRLHTRPSGDAGESWRKTWTTQPESPKDREIQEVFEADFASQRRLAAALRANARPRGWWVGRALFYLVCIDLGGIAALSVGTALGWR